MVLTRGIPPPIFSGAAEEEEEDGEITLLGSFDLSSALLGREGTRRGGCPAFAAARAGRSLIDAAAVVGAALAAFCFASAAAAVDPLLLPLTEPPAAAGAAGLGDRAAARLLRTGVFDRSSDPAAEAPLRSAAVLERDR